MENNEENKQNEVVTIELPAPPGWIKKFTPKEGGTPRRNDIVFTAPTGEDIKTKRQLDHYLKSRPGGPSAVDFDWGTGDTPRRSTRLSKKSNIQEVPEIVTSKKKQKKHSEKEEAKENEDADGVEGNDDKDAATEETKGGPDVSMADAENAGDDGGGEFTADGALLDEHNIEDEEEEPPAADVPIDSTTDKVDARVEKSKDATAEVAGLKVEESKDATADVPIDSTTDKVDARVEKSKDATAEVEGTKVEEFKDATADVASAKVEECKDRANDVKIEESKGKDYAEKELLDGKVDSVEAAAADKDESKDNQEKEKKN